MQFRFLVHIAFALALTPFAQAEMNMGLGVMGFQAWKAGRIEEAKTQLERLQGESAADKAVGERGPGEKSGKPADAKSVSARGIQERLQKAPRGDQRLQQAQLNLEIAQEFNVNDYFVLYLSQFKDRSAFLEAARKLSVDETADLMSAYQKSIASNGAVDAALPPPSLGASGEMKTARP